MEFFEILNHSLDGFRDDIFYMIQHQYPYQVEKFMYREGEKLRKRTEKKAKSTIKKRTGNYLEGLKLGKYYIRRQTNASSIRVYAAPPAYHAHLIEYGHQNARAFYIYQSAMRDFEDTYNNDCEEFADNLVDELN